MSRFELLKETLLGNLSGRVPLSLWKHHPKKDRTPEGLAEEEIAFHKKYDHDIIKISFHGRYAAVDWGCLAVYDGAISGSTICTNSAIEQPSDWEVLEPLDVNAGDLGRQIHAVKLIQEYAQGHVPTMATIFDAPMVADKLCKGKLTDYMDSHPDIIKGVLDMINLVMIDFGKAVLDAGADGLFIASQHSTYDAVSTSQYDKFVHPCSLAMISNLRGKAKFITMHFHTRKKGAKIRLSEIARTPGLDALNWDAQSASLTLSEGKELSRKAVFGGIDHNGVLRKGTPDDVKDQVLIAAREAGLLNLIISPGCAITVDTPAENVYAVVDLVKSIDPFTDEWEAHT